MRRALCAHELSNPRLPRKAPTELTAVVTVPQTDSGGRGEYPKALERTHPKELGKITTVTSGEGRPAVGERPRVSKRALVAEKSGVATVYQKHRTLLSRKTTYRV